MVVWAECPDDDVESAAAVRLALSKGVMDKSIRWTELVELTMMLFDAPTRTGTGPSTLLLRWLQEHVYHYQQYVEGDPQFQANLAALIQQRRDPSGSAAAAEPQRCGEREQESTEGRQREGQEEGGLRDLAGRLGALQQPLLP